MESAHHFSFRPDCNNTADVPFLILRTALLSRQSHSFPICVKLCQIPKNCQCKWLLVSSSAPRTSASSFCVSWEVFVLHGRIEKLWRDSHPSLRTLVIKSPKLSALGTTVRVRLLQEALVIFVLKQVSHLLSFGSKGNSWEELEASRCSGTPSSTSPCLNSCSQYGTPCNSSLCNSLCLFYLGFRFLLISATGFSVPMSPRSYFHFLLLLEFPRQSQFPAMKM